MKIKDKSRIIIKDNYPWFAFENSEEIVFKNRDVRKAVAKLVAEVHKMCPKSRVRKAVAKLFA